MQRKSGYDCPLTDCDFHCDDVVMITVHIGTHKIVVTERPEPRWAATAGNVVVGRGDDLEALVNQHPGANFGMVG